MLVSHLIEVCLEWIYRWRHASKSIWIYERIHGDVGAVAGNLREGLLKATRKRIESLWEVGCHRIILQLLDGASVFDILLRLLYGLLIYIPTEVLNIILSMAGLESICFIIGLLLTICFIIGFSSISCLRVSGSYSICSIIPWYWGSSIISYILSGSTALEMALMYWGWFTASYPPTPKGEELPRPVLIPAPGTACSFDVRIWIGICSTFFGYFLVLLITTITVALCSFAFYAVLLKFSILPLKTSLISVRFASNKSAKSFAYSSKQRLPSNANSIVYWFPWVLLNLIIGISVPDIM